MCQGCWTMRYFPKDAVVVESPAKERCAYCAEPTEAGIYVLDRVEWIEHETRAVPLFEFSAELGDASDDGWVLAAELGAAITTKCIPVRVEAEGFRVAIVYCGVEPHHVDNTGVLRPHYMLEAGMDFIVHLTSDEPRREARVRVYGIDFGTTTPEIARHNKPVPAHGSSLAKLEPLRVELKLPTG